MSICIAPINETSLRRSGIARIVKTIEISQFYLHTMRFSRKRNELYLPLPSQPQLVLIYRPRIDGRLNWCELSTGEIRTNFLHLFAFLVSRPPQSALLHRQALTAPKSVVGVSHRVFHSRHKTHLFSRSFPP